MKDKQKANFTDEELVAFSLSSKRTWRSPLWEYEIAIDRLLALKCSQVEVVDWLSKEPRGLPTTKSDLSIWLKRRAAKIEKSRKAKMAGTGKPIEDQGPTPEIRYQSAAGLLRPHTAIELVTSTQPGTPGGPPVILTQKPWVPSAAKDASIRATAEYFDKLGKRNNLDSVRRNRKTSVSSLATSSAPPQKNG